MTLCLFNSVLICAVNMWVSLAQELDVEWQDCSGIYSIGNISNVSINPIHPEIDYNFTVTAIANIHESVNNGSFELEVRSVVWGEKFFGNICEPYSLIEDRIPGDVYFEGISCPIVENQQLEINLEISFGDNRPNTTVYQTLIAADGTDFYNSNEMFCLMIISKFAS